MRVIKPLSETKKNIIILGASRTGKSTLARRLCKKLKYNIVQLDSLVSTFEKVYPELNIKHDSDEGLVTKRFAPFAMEYLKELNQDVPRRNGINYIIEGVYIDLDEFFQHFKKDDFIIIGLCCSQITPEDIFNNLRKHDNILDWTYYCKDDIELMGNARYFYKKNLQFEATFKKYNINFYDVSCNRIKVFKQIEKDIITQIN